ncbi:MAG: type III PLP-dependent enzyme [Candidatus Zixiibacteriota bacterium]|nr:MAG: type III PLP-dependent enzyme [candidate division Zixibacteria bacterium]
MTHSLTFSQATRTAIFRGTNTELVSDLFRHEQPHTPLMLLSRSEIRRNYQALQAALPRTSVYYAVKSNNHQVMLDEVHSMGGNFDVCSASEIESAIRTGVRPSTLVHTHPIKQIREFDQAVASGVEIFVVDNPAEVVKFTRYSEKKLKVLIRYRINTNTKAVVNLQYKFGCTPDEVLPLARMVEKSGHEFHGLCFHIGSQCVYSENYVKAIKTARELIETLAGEGLQTRMLDIGGGFPVQYVQPVPSIDDLCAPINRALDEKIDPNIKVICEPGRFISATPVTLVCSVVGKALRDGKIWYYLDDGLYSTFSGMLYDQCQYPIVTDQPGDGQLSVIAGPTCDSFDVMYDGLMIPDHAVGDTMVFPLTGAYCAVSASDFNSLKRPDYIIID